MKTQLVDSDKNKIKNKNKLPQTSFKGRAKNQEIDISIDKLEPITKKPKPRKPINYKTDAEFGKQLDLLKNAQIIDSDVLVVPRLESRQHGNVADTLVNRTFETYFQEDLDFCVGTGYNNRIFYKCLKCQIMFWVRRDCVRHCLLKHFDAGDKTFDCEICGKKFSNPFTLTTHKKEVHFQPRSGNFKCSVCEKIYKSKLIKLRCEKAHAGIFDFNCIFCPRKFKTKISLNSHVKVKHHQHSKVKCAICFKAYNTYELLKTHVKRKHENRPQLSYKCDQCLKVYQSKHSLRAHEVGHIGFHCDKCGEKCTSKRRLKSHMKKAHFIIEDNAQNMQNNAQLIQNNTQTMHNNAQSIQNNAPTIQNNAQTMQNKLVECQYCREKFPQKQINMHIYCAHTTVESTSHLTELNPPLSGKFQIIPQNISIPQSISIPQQSIPQSSNSINTVTNITVMPVQMEQSRTFQMASTDLQNCNVVTYNIDLDSTPTFVCQICAEVFTSKAHFSHHYRSRHDVSCDRITFG